MRFWLTHLWIRKKLQFCESYVKFRKVSIKKRKRASRIDKNCKIFLSDEMLPILAHSHSGTHSKTLFQNDTIPFSSQHHPHTTIHPPNHTECFLTPSYFKLALVPSGKLCWYKCFHRLLKGVAPIQALLHKHLSFPARTRASAILRQVSERTGGCSHWPHAVKSVGMSLFPRTSLSFPSFPGGQHIPTSSSCTSCVFSHICLEFILYIHLDSPFLEISARRCQLLSALCKFTSFIFLPISPAQQTQVNLT